MGLSGDSLSVFSLLAGGALSAGIGAFTTHGWKAKALWGLTGAFALAIVAYLIFKNQVEASTVLSLLYALIPVVTVAIVGAQVHSLRSQSAEAALTSSAPEPSVPKQEHEPPQPSGKPDARLVQVFEYVRDSSTWAQTHKATGPEVLREMRDKLSLRDLSAWGRRDPNAPIERIPWRQWSALFLNTGNGGAQTDAGDLVWHDVQFDMGAVYRLWPHPRSWMTN